MIRAGTLKHQISIERYTEQQDLFGEPIKSWSVLNTVRANLKPLNGKEEFNIQIKNTVTHKITIRYTNITPKDRLTFNSRIFDIQYVLNINEENEELQILAEEKYYE